ncbi:MAG: hypothetical protein NZ739_01925 [Verrucomicrobiae bacterium]|nr:hypothetical protein [Verrucomicrobiae bacterium]MCX7722802.1 hypothetical protein [Verrucomicrobiae bacterium]MDW7981082.1 hypothetical protein [Verrucomicrobiales bacterium]
MEWYLYRSGPGAPTFNMAMDEALLEFMPQIDTPVLRFYGWAEPAATFGYFQKYSEVERATRLRPLIRRPTGGGLVPHAADWTYSLVFPASHPWYRLRAAESYRSVHAWVQAAFSLIGVPTELAPNTCIVTQGQCFAGWEESDLLWHGRKIAGAAQRRTRTGLLIQGSIQPAAEWPHRSAWEDAMIRTGAERLGIHWAVFEPEPILLERARELAARKYALESYNRKR